MITFNSVIAVVVVLCHHPTLCSLKISDIYCCWNIANNLEIELWHSVEGFFFINNDVRLMWRCSLPSPAVPGPWRWSEDGWIVTSVTSLSRSQGGLHLGLSRVGLAPAPAPCYCNNCRPESSESGRARDQSGRLTRRYRGGGGYQAHLLIGFVLM